jgi:adenosyl cobinamide kinase/adenosyl cobinamide phosphate guanylyltransferase
LKFIIGGKGEEKASYAKRKWPEAVIVDRHHLVVRNLMQNGEDPFLEAEHLTASEKDGLLVVISDEIGCGVVPADSFERKWRETNGRINCYLAEHADEVIRMTAGIGVRIK